MGKKYHQQTNAVKNAISNGFNSILGLTDNDNDENSQKSLFGEEEWKTLHSLWNKKKKWKALDDDIQRRLKKIEEVAATNLLKAYQDCLHYQGKYSFSDKECYFEVYAAIIKILQRNKNILQTSSKSFNEQDYVVTVWSKIFETVFYDTSNNMFCRWGDSVPEESTNEKRSSNDSNSSSIGDKIDLRVCTTVGKDNTVDLLAVEFAKGTDANKFHTDHRKVLRLAKVNANHFYRSKHLDDRTKRSIRGQSIQVADVEAQMNEVKPVDNGLYVASKSGSLMLPSCGADLRKLRTVLERLFTLNRSLVSQSNYAMMIEQESSRKKTMNDHQNQQGSPYDPPSPTAVTKTPSYNSYVRGSWFPPAMCNKRFHIILCLLFFRLKVPIIL